MKKNIHPSNYKDLEVVLTNGKSFKTKSCYDKSNVVKLDVDPINHPAWKDKTTNFINASNSQVSRFKKKFGADNFDYTKENSNENN
jgi:ribosomal protein L31